MLDLRTLYMHIPSQRKAVEELLHSCGIRLEEVDLYMGVYDPEENLIAGAGLRHNIIKCVAVSEAARDMGLTNLLISSLMREASACGFNKLYLFTKPENEPTFASLAFHPVGKADKAILMETDPRGISSYCGYLRELRARYPEGKAGVIVMNCNPLTLGHRYLIEQAASKVDILFIIPVKEDASQFSYAERKAMLEAASADIPGVVICEGSDYAISAATFPSYFLKRKEDATDTYIALDLDIFTRHIASALGVSNRFVGNEPTDPLTARYNELMHTLLPAKGIEVIEIPRFEIEGEAVSASRVRRLLAERRMSEVAKLVPLSSMPVILAHVAADCLQQELDCTPKPGLVDTHDSGAHKDMDYQLMSASIRAIKPGLSVMAREALKDDDRLLVNLGTGIEQSMLEATGGVNTHKGAIFSVSITLAAYMRLLRKHDAAEITSAMLGEEISRIACNIPRATDTHGSSVHERHKLPGALDNARNAYEQLRLSWLPFMVENSDNPHCLHLTLLKIMTELCDSNVLHRAGLQGAEYLKEKAAALLRNFSLQGMSELNADFIEKNLSPGGAADMLALTLLFNYLSNTE